MNISAIETIAAGQFRVLPPTSRHRAQGTDGPVVRLVQFDPKHPLRKNGVRLGSWTNRFYRPMWQVEVQHEDGRKELHWVRESRVLRSTIYVPQGMVLGSLGSDGLVE